MMLRYRFKLILNEKVIFFWTLLFPMLLATFFNFTLKDAFNVQKVQTLNIAVLENENYKEDRSLQTLIQNLDLINVTFVDSKDEGLSLIESKTVSGYLENDKGLKLVVNDSNMEGTTLSYIFDTYESRSQMLQDMVEKNPELIHSDLFKDSFDSKDYFEPNVARNNETVVVIYFYTTLAMLCVYAGQWGVKSASYLQADESDVAKRTNIAPTSKLKLMLTDISVVFFIYLVQFVILFSYLFFVLKIPFGDNLQIIILTALLGGLVNIMLGYSIALIFKAKAISIISFGGVIASFLSGMQFVGMKYLVEQHLPLLAYINPAALITDNFYITYYYNDLSRAYLNLGILGLMAVLIGTYCVYRMKGVSYDSL